MVLYEGGTTTERMVLYEEGLLQKGWSYMRGRDYYRKDGLI